MSTSYESILDDIAEYLIFLSKAQSFWFTLNSSFDHGSELWYSMAATRGNKRQQEATRRRWQGESNEQGCGHNNQLEVMGAATDDSNDR